MSGGQIAWGVLAAALVLAGCGGTSLSDEPGAAASATCQARSGSAHRAPLPADGVFTDPRPYVPTIADLPPGYHLISYLPDEYMDVNAIAHRPVFRQSLIDDGFVRTYRAGVDSDLGRGSLSDSVTLFRTDAGSRRAFPTIVDESLRQYVVLESDQVAAGEKLGDEHVAYHAVTTIYGVRTETYFIFFRYRNAINVAAGTGPDALGRTVKVARMALDLLVNGHFCARAG